MKQFGETVAGYNIPVLNEREIRGGAGVLFLFMMVSFLKVIFDADFTLLKYFITFFMLDMAIRVFISYKFSPSLIIARYMVQNQTPIYVGAPQKRFAWLIGLSLSAAMFVHVVMLNAYGVVNGLSCMICMVLMFSELAFGICIGCKVYGIFNKDKVQYCPGEVCEIKDRHEIQKITITQVVALILFIGLIFGSYYFFNDTFLIPAQELSKALNNFKF